MSDFDVILGAIADLRKDVREVDAKSDLRHEDNLERSRSLEHTVDARFTVIEVAQAKNQAENVAGNAAITMRLDLANERLDVANGRTTNNELRIATMEAAAHLSAALAAGRKAQRDDDYAKVRSVQTFFSDFWPLLLGVAIGAAAIVTLAWDWRPI